MSVKLLEERQLFRRFEISMPGAAATYLVEWLAGVSKNDTVAVDGQVVAAGGGWGKSQDFRFRIGDQEALLSVQLSMMKKVTSLKLIVGEGVVYTEGEALSSAAQSSASPDELEKLRSPLQPPKLVRRLRGGGCGRVQRPQLAIPGRADDDHRAALRHYFSLDRSRPRLDFCRGLSADLPGFALFRIGEADQPHPGSPGQAEFNDPARTAANQSEKRNHPGHV